MKSTHLSHHHQGITLIESMVAIVVLALGLLGILGAQMRSLAHTQDSARRLQAIRLIEDLSERLKAQPDAIGKAALYTTDSWIDLAANNAYTQNTHACISSACTPTELGNAEHRQWLTNVAQALPLAQANVFATGDSKQLGVMLAWRSNENNAQAFAALSPASGGDADVTCPNDRICHLQYISLNQRCIPMDGDKASCPGH